MPAPTSTRHPRPLHRRLLSLSLALTIGSALPIAGPASASAAATKPINKAGWLSKVQLTEYYPAPESWFVGARVPTPGVPGKLSRVDWLYSARGLSMQGDGVGTDGKRYHIDNLGSSRWITASGGSATFGVGGAAAPFWRQRPSWRSKSGRVTFPLGSGGWSAGKGTKEVAADDISFAPGPSRPLSFYRSVAVDPKLIAMGSLVWLYEYATNKSPQLGWMRADDTGGAIDGRHLDVYTPPPATANGSVSNIRGARIFVVPAAKIPAYLAAERAADRDGLPLPPASILSGA